jgi:NAD(P)-dependent dehydrogenase (short-subunit alcohol dehydrogenase family)
MAQTCGRPYLADRLRGALSTRGSSPPPGLILVSKRDAGQQNPAERILLVNLTGPFLCARAALPAMIRQGSGKIVTVVSIGDRMGIAGIAACGATRAGLIRFTACLAAEVNTKRTGSLSARLVWLVVVAVLTLLL